MSPKDIGAKHEARQNGQFIPDVQPKLPEEAQAELIVGIAGKGRSNVSNVRSIHLDRATEVSLPRLESLDGVPTTRPFPSLSLQTENGSWHHIGI
ncbi:MAG: hypothetical protein A3B24_02195 [Candidatus Wildermuthbacteria bacterium RIFCSPLOWO2_01_FULL_48_16]|uniref:Uncharacterized protein n=1 Tax=Candidatus Wildermuthbacteria bacterium RIFCSPLOWO2_01_FULL_48_16 TaxID=1802461 RepID=A0A1G2RLZ9_9BACT|nr:MAG: hypothetical protein A3B24_02195 [Candidatus Wildermuthbacteria bacterium RIFCSPLOWO2_01_FULL_48_16]